LAKPRIVKGEHIHKRTKKVAANMAALILLSENLVSQTYIKVQFLPQSKTSQTPVDKPIG